MLAADPRAWSRVSRLSSAGRVVPDRPDHRADRVRVPALARALQRGAATLPPGGVVHGHREHHGAHRRRHDRRARPAAGNLSGARRTRGAHDRGHCVGPRRRAGDRRPPATDVPRRHAAHAPQGGGRSAGHGEGSGGARLQRGGAARAAARRHGSEFPHFHGSRRDHRVQQREVRARHEHSRDLRPTRRGRADACLLPGPRAREGEARRHSRKDVSPGGRAAMGVPHAPGRPRSRPRAADTTLDALARPGYPPHQKPPVSDAAPLVEELVPTPDPLETCARFADLPFLVLLDSTADPDLLGRHSFLTADPYTAVRTKGLLTQQLESGRWNRVADDPLARVRELLAPYRADGVAGGPPFQGGAAGYGGYDWGAALERGPRARYDDLAVPDLLLGPYAWGIPWGPPAARAGLVSPGLPERGAHAARRAGR